MLEDHAAKAAAGQVQRLIVGSYNQNIGVSQFGATAGRGTDFAHHTLRCFLFNTKARSKSFFVLFADLIMAFDRVVRQLVMGWPPGVEHEEQVRTFMSAGFSEEVATCIADTVAKNGCVVEQWGCR